VQPESTSRQPDNSSGGLLELPHIHAMCAIVNNHAGACSAYPLLTMRQSPHGTARLCIGVVDTSTNWLGVPREGYGFSNDIKGLFSAPEFSAASFQYDGHNLELTISLHY
jgi:Uncharacterized protein conserved in bacteria (DUF2141)